MAIEVRKASRKKVKMRCALCSPAGGGKTMSSLLIAYGLVGDWDKIGLVDTENGSGELYVGQQVPGSTLVIGEYQYARIRPPFAVARYMEAQAALEELGCEVIILDSISHAWAGEGGLLDKQGQIAKKSGNSYTAWRDVTPDHNAFIEMMLQSPAHIIATMRSKVEYVLETNDKGKQAPRKVGMAPVQREGLDFEFSVVFDLDQEHIASSSKDRTSLFDGQFFKPSVATGKQMLAWLNAGVEPPTRPNPDDELVQRIRAALAKAPDLATVDKITGHRDAQRLAEHIVADLTKARKRLEAPPAPPVKTPEPITDEVLDNPFAAVPA